MKEIKFAHNKSSKLDILKHLQLTSENFFPPLNERVDLDQYSTKIFLNAERFEAWGDEKLVGLVGAYFNSQDEVFVTTVSVISEFLGQGIAKQLMQQCVDKAKADFKKSIILEVSKESVSAFELYTKLGFKILNQDKMIKMELAV